MEFIDEFEKMYKVEFIDRDFVDGSVLMRDNRNNSILSIIKPPDDNIDFIIPESQLDYYKRFGNGYKSIELVGYMPIYKVEEKDE